MKKKLTATFTGTAMAASLAMTTPALAHPRPQPHAPQLTTVASGLISPLSLAVGSGGTLYTTQNFAGQLDRVSPHGKVTPLYTSTDGSEVGGVSVHGRTVTFTLTGPKTLVLQRDQRGHIRTLADVGAYEAKYNPDRRVHYGISNLSKSCAAQFPEEVPASYTGLVDSHPYATTESRGTTYVADAAGNTVLSIDRRGHVRTVAVLPAQPAVVTAAAAAASGLPACTVGKTYRFEPVPTDVEVGPDGWLYVSTLPGGPEDASLGARGAVYKVNPHTGKTHRVATGFLGATNLAVTRHGDIYVTELFGDRISLIKRGSHKAVTWVNTTMPAAVEATSRDIYATTGVLIGMDPGSAPGGMIVKARVNTSRW
ncbi:ScyD/ScyE family protein [Leekyejoonella antrihumi]|uniref:ScyD/ScyE family protein n=1 Tax=Leekyejoonella antrihumi TaxID=1660198 RepID=A0A563E2U6_9MICO|nr:ScyD/ScyE family protein [Leekyejoonella antrihumi]TWP36846.1 ScyD/ScyE family protein [Leekyejoonella antrihumi]